MTTFNGRLSCLVSSRIRRVISQQQESNSGQPARQAQDRCDITGSLYMDSWRSLTLNKDLTSVKRYVSLLLAP